VNPDGCMPSTLNAAPSEKPVLFMSVSLGWAIRNFFQTGIVERLKSHFEVVVLASPQARRSLCELGFDQGIKVIEFDPGEEPLTWKLFRQLKKKIYMESRESATEAIWERYFPRPLYQRVGGRVIKSCIRLLNARRLYIWVDKLDSRINSDNRLSAVFGHYKPAIFFATHATAYFEECLLRNAIAANVPPVFMILSWDHLSSKILLNLHLHSLLVWNDHTKQEVLQTYPFYRSEQIRVTGIPQYDVYVKKPNLTYADWCRRYNLDPERRTILFSTMPQSRHEQQHIILEELLKAIAEGKRLPSDLQVLIKCHPFDNFEGYDELLGRYPVGIYRNSFDSSQTQDDWIPSAEEMEVSRDALYFCTININIFSTVTIEASYFDKPVVHIAFDPLPIKGRIPCHEYYNWDHFKPIVDVNATILVHGYEELFDAINQFMAKPALKARERKILVEKYIGRAVGTASDAVTSELIDICKRLEGGRGPRT
jgi:hypothetical protein